jgi:hypothetical protein
MIQPSVPAEHGDVDADNCEKQDGPGEGVDVSSDEAVAVGAAATVDGVGAGLQCFSFRRVVVSAM